MIQFGFIVLALTVIFAVEGIEIRRKWIILLPRLIDAVATVYFSPYLKSDKGNLEIAPFHLAIDTDQVLTERGKDIC